MAGIANGDKMRSFFEAKKKLEKTKGQLKQFQSWFDSAMTMVDHTPVSLLWCNAEDDFSITYMNKAAKEGLTLLGEYLPCGVDEVNGSKVDVLFKNSDAPAPDVSNADNLPYAKRIKLGDEFLDVAINAVIDNKGQYCGAMLTWNIVTKQVTLVQDFESSIKSMVENLSETSKEVERNAQGMSSTAEQTNSCASAVADASSQASENVQTVSSAAEQLSTSTSEITRLVETSNQIASEAVIEADKTNSAVAGLATATDKIGEVVQFITDIASQTNLLALNATIEAARAGEAGKGFAVVANEVKSLANQTAKATEEISEQISTIQKASTGAVAAIKQISATISRINNTAAEVSNSVEQQTAATSEISKSIGHTAEASRNVSSNIAQVTQAAGNSNSMAGELLQSSHSLTENSAQLGAAVDSFLAKIEED